MKKGMRTVVRNLVILNRRFTVVNNDCMYLSIEDKYITDGKLNTTLYGYQLHPSRDLDECIRNTENHVKIDDLISKGYTKMRAICTVLNVPYNESFEKLDQEV